MVVSARNILHAAFALCTAFLGVGALYLFLHADFVAAVQLIVYVGGILVLIMFAVMFSSNVAEDTSGERRGWFSMATGGVAALAVFGGIYLMIQRLEKPLAEQNQYAAVDYVNTVGVHSDTQSKEDIALIKSEEKALNLTSPIDKLSNEDLHKRVDSTPGDKAKHDELYAALERNRGRYGIGHKLIGEYLLPFEVASILLLAALVGAVVIVRKELS